MRDFLRIAAIAKTIGGGDDGGGGGSNTAEVDALITRTASGEWKNDRVTKIASYLFQSCFYITSISFPNVETVGKYAFNNCNQIPALNFPKCISVEDYAFKGCGSAKTAYFPLLETIGTSSFNCRVLEEIHAPLVTSVGSTAFDGCSMLKSIDFQQVGTIGANAFRSCTLLETFVNRKQDAVCTMANKYVFQSTPIESGTGFIYVPAALIDSYKAATYWSTYAAQFRAIEDYTVDGTVTGALDETKI